MDTFTTCHSCAVVIVNGDDSAWEFWLEENQTSAKAAVELIGMYDSYEVEDSGQYFDCFVCDDLCIGEEFIFTTAERN